MTLKEAAEKTGRSVTTLRRYIRATRLRAEKTPGRFGPEYTLDEAALREAGFPPLAEGMSRTRSGSHLMRSLALTPPEKEPVGSGEDKTTALSRPVEKLLLDYVPADLYRELAMKHEQLLVQYGMIRASGQRLFEFREEAAGKSEELRRVQERQKESTDRASREIGFLKQHLRQAELEIEEKNQQIGSLREKVRMLELLTRNAITNESIEQQFLKVYEKERELDVLVIGASESPEEILLAASSSESLSSVDEEEAGGAERLEQWIHSRLGGAQETEKSDH